MVRREYQENPEYHVHSVKARELTEREYQKLYNEFLTKYDVNKSEELATSVEEEGADN